MKICIGLPHYLADAPASLMADWARRAERRGFDSVSVGDRLVYPSMDAIVALSIAAGATSRLALVTNVLLAPLYPRVILAKQIRSLAAAAGNRLFLGIGAGAREDDYDAAGVDFTARGSLMDEVPAVLEDIWSGRGALHGSVSYPTSVRIPILYGGQSTPALRRATTVGDGWVAGGLRDYPAQAVFADRVRAGWREAGRNGQPLLHATASFAIGSDEVLNRGRAKLAHYYGFSQDYANRTVADMVSTATDARETVSRYRDIGFDRLIFSPTVPSLDQVDLLADAVL